MWIYLDSGPSEWIWPKLFSHIVRCCSMHNKLSSIQSTSCSYRWELLYAHVWLWPTHCHPVVWRRAALPGSPQYQLQPTGQRPPSDDAFFFLDATEYDNTWVGSIGVAAPGYGQNTTLQFTAADQMIRIGDRAELDAKTIKKLTSTRVSYRFSMFHLTTPRSALEFLWTSSIPSSLHDYKCSACASIPSSPSLCMGFTRNSHLDLYWHSTRISSKVSIGIVGMLKFIASCNVLQQLVLGDNAVCWCYFIFPSTLCRSVLLWWSEDWCRCPASLYMCLATLRAVPVEKRD